MLKSIMQGLGNKARMRRADFLRRVLYIPEAASILDLGGGDGAHIAKVFPNHRNITVCDYSESDLSRAAARGFKTKLADGTNRLPFEDGEFDFVFCSSVIEHVTGPKSEAISNTNGQSFRETALLHQMSFAEEVRRVGKQYYVQTPHKLFLVESHSWLPLPFVFLPRPALVSVLKQSGKVLKVTAPDWNLLVPAQMKSFFPEAEIHIERVGGWPKSIMAIKGSPAAEQRLVT